MKKTLKIVSAFALVTGLAVGGIAITSTNAAAGCRTENTDYDGTDESEKNCLGGTCSAGWCCLICERPA